MEAAPRWGCRREWRGEFESRWGHKTSFYARAALATNPITPAALAKGAPGPAAFAMNTPGPVTLALNPVPRATLATDTGVLPKVSAKLQGGRLTRVRVAPRRPYQFFSLETASGSSVPSGYVTYVIPPLLFAQTFSNLSRG